MFHRLRQDLRHDPRVRRARSTLYGALVAAIVGPITLLIAFVMLLEQQAEEGIGTVQPAAWVLFAMFAATLVWAMIVLVRAPWAYVVDLAEDAAASVRTVERGTLEALQALNATVEAKDRYTAGHGLRVTLIAILIGQELGLDDAELDVLRYGATFHDIGKIAVPDQVLRKAGRLSDDEFRQLKSHPVESARICEKLGVLRSTVPAVRYHHERWDGFGYPDGLSATAIPLGARIIAVADTWDAITSDRPYRLGQPPQSALTEIIRVAGSQLDPGVVEAFLNVLQRDPWMFGLRPADLVIADGADPVSAVPQSLLDVDDTPEGVPSSSNDHEEMDWTVGFDEHDLAA